MILSSLRNRIFLTSALLAVLSIGAAIYLVSVRVTHELEESLQHEIRSTGQLVEQLRATRAQMFEMSARLIADAPTLKAAVDTDDPATVQNNATIYQNQLNSNLLLVTNKAGDVLATVGASSRAALVVATQPSVRKAIEGGESLSLIPQPDGILHLVTVPIVIGISHPDILGTLSVGFLLDDAFAQQLKQITGSEIAFGMDGQILASTLPPEARPALSALLIGWHADSNITFHDEEYVALPLPLSQGNATGLAKGPVALILRSRTEQLRFLHTIHTELGGTAVIAVILATILSFAVARTITRPLATITAVMREVATTGDLTRKIVLRRASEWDDEDAQLLATTFNTLTDSIAQAQREISQRERLSSLGRLSTVIAHEVRNPLMIIKAALHTLRQSNVSAVAVREAAADIDGEVIRLNRIVNDVLDFARPIRFEFAPADINTLCRESANAAQVSPGAKVDVQLDQTVPVIRTDAERLRIALVNLIVNARDAMRSDDARVSVSTRFNGSAVAIVIADRGAGIDRADLPRIFDPYFTTKRGGTGLGLPIAKNIVEGLGGAITVSSNPGTGTAIRVELPLDLAHEPSAPADRDRPLATA
jgi:signal transduction histidine kinase